MADCNFNVGDVVEVVRPANLEELPMFLYEFLSEFGGMKVTIEKMYEAYGNVYAIAKESNGMGCQLKWLIPVEGDD